MDFKKPEETPKIIKTFMAPRKWKSRGGFDLPSKGPIPKPIREYETSVFLNRKVFYASCHLGSYGMGGPGFLGLGLSKTADREPEFLVLRLWGADNWVHFDGKIIDNHPDQGEKYGNDKFCETVKDQILTSIDMQDKTCVLKIGDHVMEYRLDAKERPPLAGSGALRDLLPDESLLDAWIVCPVESEERFPILVV